MRLFQASRTLNTGPLYAFFATKLSARRMIGGSVRARRTQKTAGYKGSKMKMNQSKSDLRRVGMQALASASRPISASRPSHPARSSQPSNINRKVNINQPWPVPPRGKVPAAAAPQRHARYVVFWACSESSLLLASISFGDSVSSTSVVIIQIKSCYLRDLFSSHLQYQHSPPRQVSPPPLVPGGQFLLGVDAGRLPFPLCRSGVSPNYSRRRQWLLPPKDVVHWLRRTLYRPNGNYGNH